MTGNPLISPPAGTCEATAGTPNLSEAKAGTELCEKTMSERSAFAGEQISSLEVSTQQVQQISQPYVIMILTYCYIGRFGIYHQRIEMEEDKDLVRP